MKLTTHLSTPWRWKAELALLADLQRTVYPYKWWPISCRSGADQWKFADQRPTFYHWATQPTVIGSRSPLAMSCSPCHSLEKFLWAPMRLATKYWSWSAWSLQYFIQFSRKLRNLTPMTTDLINRQIRSISPWVHFPCRGGQHYWTAFLWAFTVNCLHTTW